MPAPKRPAPKRKTRAKSPPADDALTKRVRAALSEAPSVTEKRMFGSTGFLIHGKLCITARETRLMLRINPADHDAALKREGCTTVIMKGRPYRGYIFVAATSVKTTRALNHWLKQVIDFNQRTFGKSPAPTPHKQVLATRLKAYRAGKSKPISHDKLMRRLRDPRRNKRPAVT